VTFKQTGFRHGLLRAADQACGRSGDISPQTLPLHSTAIRGSSRAFPAGRDGIAPGYACISTVESDPSGSWGGNETISVGAETSHRGFIHAAL